MRRSVTCSIGTVRPRNDTVIRTFIPPSDHDRLSLSSPHGAAWGGARKENRGPGIHCAPGASNRGVADPLVPHRPSTCLALRPKALPNLVIWSLGSTASTTSCNTAA